MNELAITTNEPCSLVVSSLDFAAGLDIQHKNLLETVRIHREVIERDFGQIAFQTRPFITDGGKQVRTVAYFTEDQALFVGTLSRNSKRVVEFKSVLVKSFADARRRLTGPSSSKTEQALLELVKQSQLLTANQQQMINKLRADVDELSARDQAATMFDAINPGSHLDIPGVHVSTPSLRQLLNRRIDDYVERNGCEHRVVWNYLYKRMFEVFAVSVQRLNRAHGESILDAIERYGKMKELYSLAVNELFSQLESR